MKELGWSTGFAPAPRHSQCRMLTITLQPTIERDWGDQPDLHRYRDGHSVECELLHYGPRLKGCRFEGDDQCSRLRKKVVVVGLGEPTDHALASAATNVKWFLRRATIPHRRGKSPLCCLLTPRRDEEIYQFSFGIYHLLPDASWKKCAMKNRK